MMNEIGVQILVVVMKYVGPMDWLLDGCLYFCQLNINVYNLFYGSAIWSDLVG